MISYFLTYEQRIGKLQEEIDDLNDEMEREVDMISARLTDLLSYRQQLARVRLRGDRGETNA